MRNFMCYRDNVPPLRFDSIHTACISGDNGNGKSALIDAITWALWGKTRARSDDDLVHSGQTEMEVEFDFAVGQQRYRIIRKHSKPKRRGRSGQTILEFQTATTDGFRSITGDSVTQTQQKIEDVLHMDYKTFVNSAFLRQGHADEFTIKRPVERKQVLADILGLSVYDKLEEQAKSLAKQQETEQTQLESAIEGINDELARKPAYQAEFEQAQSELSQVEKEIKEQESRLNELRKGKESLTNKQAQLLQLEEHISGAKRDIDQRDELAKQHHSRIKGYEELIARRAIIEQGYTRFTLAKELYDGFDQKGRQWAVLNQRKHQLEMTNVTAQQEILKDHALTENKISELEANSQKLPRLKDELHQAEVQLQQLSEQEEALRRKRQNMQELQSQINYLVSSGARLTQEIVEVEEKLKLLLTQREAQCPLCERELSIDNLKLIETKYTAERERKSESLKSNQVELVQKETGVKSLEGELSRLEARLSHDRASAQGKASILNKSIVEAEEAGDKLDGERKILAEIEQRLAGKDCAACEQESLRSLEEQIDKLD